MEIPLQPFNSALLDFGEVSRTVLPVTVVVAYLYSFFQKLGKRGWIFRLGQFILLRIRRIPKVRRQCLVYWSGTFRVRESWRDLGSMGFVVVIRDSSGESIDDVQSFSWNFSSGGAQPRHRGAGLRANENIASRPGSIDLGPSTRQDVAGGSVGAYGPVEDVSCEPDSLGPWQGDADGPGWCSSEQDPSGCSRSCSVQDDARGPGWCSSEQDPAGCSGRSSVEDVACEPVSLGSWQGDADGPGWCSSEQDPAGCSGYCSLEVNAGDRLIGSGGSCGPVEDVPCEPVSLGSWQGFSGRLRTGPRQSFQDVPEHECCSPIRVGCSHHAGCPSDARARSRRSTAGSAHPGHRQEDLISATSWTRQHGQLPRSAPTGVFFCAVRQPIYGFRTALTELGCEPRREFPRALPWVSLSQRPSGVLARYFGERYFRLVRPSVAAHGRPKKTRPIRPASSIEDSSDDRSRLRHDGDSPERRSSPPWFVQSLIPAVMRPRTWRVAPEPRRRRGSSSAPSPAG